MDVLEEMAEAGVAMDAFTYAHAIEACCNAGNRVNPGVSRIASLSQTPFISLQGAESSQHLFVHTECSWGGL